MCGSVGRLLPHVFHVGFIFLFYPGLCIFADFFLLLPVLVFRFTTGYNLLDVYRDRIHRCPFPFSVAWALDCVMTWLLTNKTMDVGLTFFNDQGCTGFYRCPLFYPGLLQLPVVVGLLAIFTMTILAPFLLQTFIVVTLVP